MEFLESQKLKFSIFPVLKDLGGMRCFLPVSNKVITIIMIIEIIVTIMMIIKITTMYY